ncbi:mucin-17 [Pipistrellus kuhlii]|nr:mucin-17 [Pipistrellus kuhlii]
MDKVYSKIPEYVGVNITELSSGSVVVQHDVILQAKFNSEYKEEFKKVTKEIEKTITNVTQQQIMSNGNCSATLCFNKNATEVINTVIDYDPEVDCREKAGKDLAKYFFVEYKDQQPKCINRCMPGFNASLNCNAGTCKLERSGPKCYCLNTDTAWYSGETCEVSTKKNLVYGLLGSAGAVVLMILVILLVFMFRSKREVKRQKHKVTQLYNWHEDGGTAPGTFHNIGFDIYEEPQNSLNLDSIYSNFQPSLEHVDSKKKIQIKRPEVTMTSL